MDQVANLQIKVQHGDVGNATAALDKLGAVAPKTQRSIDNLSSSFGGTFRSNMQNASYQIQDIAVQAQMGTNALTILGQQGPQLLSILGPAGAVAGGIVAIGAAALSMMQDVDVASESVSDFMTRLERMGSVEAGRELRNVATASDELATSQAQLQTRLDYATRAFNEGTFSAKTYAEAQEKIRIEGEKLGFVIEDNAVKYKALQDLQKGFRPQDMSFIEDMQRKLDLLQIKDPRERAIQGALQGLDEGASAQVMAKVAELEGAAYDAKKAEVDARNADRQAERDAASQQRLADQAIKAEQRKAEMLDRQATTWLEKVAFYGQSQVDRVATWQDQELSQLKDFMDAKVLTAEEGQAAFEAIMQESLNRQVNAQKAADAEKERLASEQLRSQQQTASMWLDLTSSMLDATTNMMEQSGAENTGFMKGLLAMQKMLAIPSILVSTETAAMAAMAQESLIGGLISGQTAANLIRAQGAISAGLVAGTAFAGMFDNGGVIPAGQMGIVGEFGPEFVKGPAVVTSRAKTAEMARAGASSPQGGTTVVIHQNITVSGNGDRALRDAMAQAAKQGTNDALAQVRNDAMTNGPIRRSYNV